MRAHLQRQQSACASGSPSAAPMACRSAASGPSRQPSSQRPDFQLRQQTGLQSSAAQTPRATGRGSSQATAAAAAAGAQHGVVAPFAAVRRAPEGSANNILELNEFRRGVGLCIYRADGLVFAARRMDDPQQSWQMPQGGIDPLENPMRAALRELHEETGITSCRIVASIDHWLEYTFPTKVKATPDSASFLRYRGQTQKWFLLEFLGDDSEIDISCQSPGHHAGGHHPEFSAFSWQPLESLPGGVVDFKQGVYRQVARHFAPEIARRVSAFAR